MFAKLVSLSLASIVGSIAITVALLRAVGSISAISPK